MGTGRRRNNVFYSKQRTHGCLKLTDYFKVASREGFEDSRPKEMRNVRGDMMHVLKCHTEPTVVADTPLTPALMKQRQ